MRRQPDLNPGNPGSNLAGLGIIIIRSNRLIEMTDTNFGVPPHSLEYSEDELRDFLNRNGHNPSEVHEVILDRAIRAFRRFMGDPNVKWALEDDSVSRLHSNRGHLYIGIANPPTLVKVNKRTQIERDLGTYLPPPPPPAS